MERSFRFDIVDFVGNDPIVVCFKLTSATGLAANWESPDSDDEEQKGKSEWPESLDTKWANVDFKALRKSSLKFTM